MSGTGSLPMLERRRIEAAILRHVHEALRDSHGQETAAAVVAEAVRRSAIEQAAGMAAEEPGGPSLRNFIALQERWRLGDALTIAVTEETADTYAFRVTRCRYAEMYREMGLGAIGHLLSCQRDGTFCEGYDRRLKLTRTQTIMQGASHCDFHYRWEETP